MVCFLSKILTLVPVVSFFFNPNVSPLLFKKKDKKETLHDILWHLSAPISVKDLLHVLSKHWQGDTFAFRFYKVCLRALSMGGKMTQRRQWREF